MLNKAPRNYEYVHKFLEPLFRGGEKLNHLQQIVFTIHTHHQLSLDVYKNVSNWNLK